MDHERKRKLTRIRSRTTANPEPLQPRRTTRYLKVQGKTRTSNLPLRACQEISFTHWREHRRTCGAPGAGRCQAPRRRRCGDIVEERQRRRCPPAAGPLRAAARRPAGRVAHSLLPPRACSSLAPCQRACSQVQTLFLDRPLTSGIPICFGDTFDDLILATEHPGPDLPQPRPYLLSKGTVKPIFGF